MMDVHEIRTLKLLEAIEHQQTPSQRDLAKALGVSLGLVNSFLRRLAQKGYFKTTHLPRNRTRYVLTPKGAAEKSRLTYAYIKMSYRFFRDARLRIKKLLRDLQGQKIQSVIFFGVGDLAEIAYLSLRETTLELVAIVDEDRIGDIFFEYHVSGPTELKTIPFDALIITADDADAETFGKIRTAGIAADKIRRF